MQEFSAAQSTIVPAIVYEAKDFKTITNTGDQRIPFGFTTKCRCRKPWISANFFWIPDNVTLRIIGESIECQEIAYPFVNHHGQGQMPKPEEILASLIHRLQV